MHKLGGRYRLDERLGAGGMSVVWRAYDDVLDRDVAVKLLAAELVEDPAASHRIHAEAQAIARLAHPNVGQVYDFGESVGPDGRVVPYVVMELLDGETLADRLCSGALPWRLALSVCADVAAGLAAAHARGIVHQDIKPANIMLTSTGAKVCDFGIAMSDQPQPDRPDELLLGTIAYVPPERLLKGTVSPAGDVYALGLVLYRCLSGELPWRSTTFEQTVSNHCYVMPHPLPPIDGLPPEVPALVANCLAKLPEDRPTSHEVAQVLLAAVGGRLLPAEAIPVRSAVPPAPLTGRARRTWRRRAAVLAAIALAAAVAYTVWTGRAPPDGAGSAFADAPSRAAGYGCRVWLTDGKLTVENTGDVAFPRWTLTFTASGADRFSVSQAAVLAQAGRHVTLRGQGDLPAGRWTSMPLSRTGTGAATNFAINGTMCAAITGTEPPPRTDPPVPPGGEPPVSDPLGTGAPPGFPPVVPVPPEETPTEPTPSPSPSTSSPTTPPSTSPPPHPTPSRKTQPPTCPPADPRGPSPRVPCPPRD